VKIENAVPYIGALVTGLDVKRMTNSEWQTLYQTWLDRHVLIVRGQELSKADFLAYSRRFGRLKPHMIKRTRDPDNPEITLMGVTSMAKDGDGAKLILNRGEGWHTDSPWDTEICKGTQLYGIEIPSYGGDTLFANMYLAYEMLSDGMKRLLDGLVAINSSAKADTTRTREDRVRDSARSDAKKEYVSEHPVVRTHPETGRKALYVNIGHTVRFKDMTVEESAPFLNYLYQHQTRPEFTCRFQWRVGAIALWDNRCALHNPINDYHGYRRVMHRITLAGDTPR